MPEVEAWGAPGAVVLDLGCGTGRYARTLRHQGFRVHALDFDFDALSTARALDESPEEDVSLVSPADNSPALAATSPVSYCAGRAESLPFAAAAFDAVYCIDVLHWSSGAAAFEAVWREVSRVLCAGGVFYVRLRVLESLPGAVALAEGRYRIPSGGEWFLVGIEDLKSVARAMGFKVIIPSGDEKKMPLAPEGGAAFFKFQKNFA